MMDISINTDLAAQQQAALVTDIGLSFNNEIATLTLNGGTVLDGKCSLKPPMDDFMQAIEDQAASWGYTL